MLVPDPWLSGILSRPAFALKGGIDGPLTCEAFVYSKQPTMEGALSLIGAGFALASVEVTFEGLPQPGVGCTRLATESDRSAVEDIAASSFTFDRFHRDPEIPANCADEIKRQWAGNFFSGQRGTHMFVAERDGKVVGFSQCIYKDGVLVIDLIGVRKNVRRRGVGRDLIEGAVAALKPSRVRVGTQMDNLASLALYRRLGLLPVSASFVCHYHTR